MNHRGSLVSPHPSVQTLTHHGGGWGRVYFLKSPRQSHHELPPPQLSSAPSSAPPRNPLRTKGPEIPNTPAGSRSTPSKSSSDLPEWRCQEAQHPPLSFADFEADWPT